MFFRIKYIVPCLYRRPWLAVPLGIWFVFSIVYYRWLISEEQESQQHKVYKTHVKLSEVLMRQLFVDSPTTYVVPVIPDTTGTLCETIHISILCMGKCSRQITPLLNSILHHRQNPLHFHFLVDTASNHSLSQLLYTWNLPDVKYTTYHSEEHLNLVRWIPNSHYSGVYSFLKLLNADILPKTLDKVIVLDSDLTFLSDIVELWAMFRNMSEGQVIGLVENESNWYYDTKTPWPALGRGYNTGVMLLNLHKMRNDIDWNAMWQTALDENLETLKRTALADQDVINAVIKKHPHIVYNISCQYNVQMSMNTLAKNCYREDKNNVKVIHWNSPNKYYIKNIRDADYFRNIHQFYVNFDGNLLREKLHVCWQQNIVTYKMNQSDLCIGFRAAQRVKLRTHVYYMEYSYVNNDSFDVTLVLQLSMDRLQFLERIVKYWKGPLSAAIYLADCEVNKFESFIREWSVTLSSRTNIGYHLVFKNDAVHYPVNYLRNVALDNVNTPYVFLMDVDFVPMEGLYDHLRKAIQLINPYPQKKCLVVPAFETQLYRALPPPNKAALVSRLAGRDRDGDIAPFRAREWPPGHRATNYSRWVTANEPYEVEWQSNYEPYLVVHRSVPRYDERFSGFGWNKVSHMVTLRVLGYGLVVLPRAFLLHTAHAPSPDITAFRAHPSYRICLAILKQEFLDDLKKTYNVTLDEAEKSDAYYSQAKNVFLNQAKDTD